MLDDAPVSLSFDGNTELHRLVARGETERDLDALCVALGGEGVSFRELGLVERLKIHAEEVVLWRRRGDPLARWLTIRVCAGSRRMTSTEVLIF